MTHLFYEEKVFVKFLEKVKKIKKNYYIFKNIYYQRISKPIPSVSLVAKPNVFNNYLILYTLR